MKTDSEQPPKASAKPAPPRGWRSLLTTRWHLSSRVVAICSLLFLIFCNIPGQFVSVLEEWHWGGPPRSWEWQHGWPFTWLAHGRDAGASRFQQSVRDCFVLWGEGGRIHFAALAANGVVVLGLAAFIGAAFEKWRRRGTRIWQFHLIDAVWLLVLFSVATGWYMQIVHRHHREYATGDVVLGDRGPKIVEEHEGGISWLRRWLGDDYFQVFDRPLLVSITSSPDWERLQELPTVQLVSVERQSMTADLVNLKRLPRLVALFFRGEVNVSPVEGETVGELPDLPGVRGLVVEAPVAWCRRLDRLPNLEFLEFYDGQRDHRALDEIGRLTKLRELSINKLPKSPDFSFLPSLSQLTHLNLSRGELSAENLKSIGECHSLTHLNFQAIGMSQGGLRHLAGLHQLESLWLGSADITDSDLPDFGSLPRLRHLNLWYTKVGGNMTFLPALSSLERLDLTRTQVTASDLARLTKLPQLRKLSVQDCQLDKQGWAALQQLKGLTSLTVSAGPTEQSEFAALQAALPDCQISNSP